MKINRHFLKQILTAVIFFILGILVTYFISNQKSSVQSESKPQAQSSPSASPCRNNVPSPQSDSELAKILFNNQAAIKIVKDECTLVFGSLKGKLDDSGEENLIFWGGEVGCASCHPQDVVIISEDKVIFAKHSDDPKVAIVKDDGGKDILSITEPLRKADEPLCCPSEGVTTLYTWSKPTKEFVATERTPYTYSQN